MFNIRNEPVLKLPDAKSTYYGINSIHFRACPSGMVFPSLLNIVGPSLNWKENLKNWEMFTVLVFYVDGIINKVFIVLYWFLLAFAICKHKKKIKL